jgi:hypothetical protein
MKKTIILVWTKNTCNTDGKINCNYWGLGDVIRGTIHLYNITRDLGLDYYVDMQLHSINKYFKKINHPYEKEVIDNKDNIPFVFHDGDINAIVKYIKNEKNYKDGILYMMTNGPCKINEIKQGCKDFIKNILTPNAEFQDFINEKTKLLPFTEYQILHYRFGDSEMIKNAKCDHSDFLNNVRSHINNNTVLISDSNQFKKLLKEENIDVFMFDTNICHLGHKIETNDYKETLFEFFLTTGAISIKTYTIHNWLSGFVRIANIIYDVPLIKIAR